MQLILAVYYTLADIVLLGQCFYYRGFTWKDEVKVPAKPNDGENGNGHAAPTERTSLLHSNGNGVSPEGERRNSNSNWHNIDATHLSPVTPLLDSSKASVEAIVPKPTSMLKSVLLNGFAVLMVCIAGVFGWWLSKQNETTRHHGHHHRSHRDADTSDSLDLNLWGQIFGYLCAILYLGSRIPQILLNYRRKSTEGISALFFLFACIGNLTYVLSIFAFEPKCYSDRGKQIRCGDGESGAIYGRYMLVNASWLAGSLGTLFLDFAIFVQFFLYRAKDEDLERESENEEVLASGAVASQRLQDDRPLLQRGDSSYNG